jgi:hypothetical protein
MQKILNSVIKVVVMMIFYFKDYKKKLVKLIIRNQFL